jgi:hypothetical protein
MKVFQNDAQRNAALQALSKAGLMDVMVGGFPSDSTAGVRRFSGSI